MGGKLQAVLQLRYKIRGGGKHERGRERGEGEGEGSCCTWDTIMIKGRIPANPYPSHDQVQYEMCVRLAKKS